MVITSLESERRYYPNDIPFYTKFDEKVLESFVQERWKNPRSQSMSIILDNCIDPWEKSASMKTLFLNGRNLRTSLFITMSFAHLKPELRANIDFIFIAREKNERDLLKIYEQYGGMFPTFEEFKQVVDQCTKDAFTMLVIDNTSRSDVFCWFKAEPYPIVTEQILPGRTRSETRMITSLSA